MRFLTRVKPSGLTRERALETARALARSVSAEARNPKWTSKGSLELDVFCPSRSDFDLFVAVCSPLFTFEFTKDLNTAPIHRPQGETFDEAREYFNSERYWECHEVLEVVWRQKSGPEKAFLQGIILLCAAFVHHQKGEEGVALGVLRRSLAQLEYPGRTYGGFDAYELRTRASEMLVAGTLNPFRV